MPDPTCSAFCVAYPESTTASSAFASAGPNELPEESVAALSGPDAAWSTSTPTTLNAPVVKLDWKVLALLPAVMAGTVPVTVASVSARPPTAAETPCCAATVARSATGRAEYGPSARSLMSMLLPAATCPCLTALSSWENPKVVRSLVPWAGAWVSVRSVPTP